MALILPPRIAAKYQKIKEAKKIANRIAYEVNRVYPGHPFQFEVDYEKGYVFIDHILLSSNGARYFVKDTDGIQAVIQMCGELLERVNLPRNALEHFDQIDGAMSTAREAYKAV